MRKNRVCQLQWLRSGACGTFTVVQTHVHLGMKHVSKVENREYYYVALRDRGLLSETVEVLGAKTSVVVVL